MEGETLDEKLRAALPVPTNGEPWRFAHRRLGQKIAAHAEFPPMLLIEHRDGSWRARTLFCSQN